MSPTFVTQVFSSGDGLMNRLQLQPCITLQHSQGPYFPSCGQLTAPVGLQKFVGPVSMTCDWRRLHAGAAIVAIGNQATETLHTL